MSHFSSSANSKLENDSARHAVSVRNAFKKYSSKKESNHILNNFSMSVEEGHIYSLLGSSGCGKTTLLSCVVGMRKLDSGEIFVFGARPGTKGSGIPGRKVGYMPQEIALYGEFSIAEVLQYFGRLYGMPKWEVEDNTKFLISFLNLPPESRRINTLSGGQQRRVSFAVALVHNPELLILDEPTVGVDPLLRQSIWSHLVKLAQRAKTTIIITTHFIEEARDSNCIGLMRNGKLLAEESPAVLMERYNTVILEEIVVRLCLRDTNPSGEENGETVPPLSSTSVRTRVGTSGKVSPDDGPDLISVPDDIVPIDNLPGQKRLSLGQILHRASRQDLLKKQNNLTVEATEKAERIYALLTKNVLVLVRNIGLVLFILGIPPLQVVLICLAIGKDPHGIQIGLVNNEVGSGDSCNNLSQKAGCIMSSAQKYNSHASCQFIQELDLKIFTLIPYESEEEAIEDVRRTKIWGVMTFPPNFTEHLKERVQYGLFADEKSLASSRITLHLDLSNTQIGLQLKKNFFSTLEAFMYTLAKDCKVDTNGLDIPLHFDTPVYGTDDTNFTEFVAPGILLAILFFYPLCSTGVSMIMEKKSGAMERTKVAGVTDLDIMISHFLTQVVLLFFQTVLSFFIMVSVFNIRVRGSLFLVFALGNLIGISGISFGFVLAAVCKDELGAVMLALGAFLPNFILSGVLWPIEGMPFYLQYISTLLPCTLAGESMRSIIGRGLGFTHTAIWPGFLTTAFYICLYWALTLGISRLRKVN